MNGRTVISSNQEYHVLARMHNVLIAAPQADGCRWDQIGEHGEQLVKVNAEHVCVDGEISIGPGAILRAAYVRARKVRVAGALFALCVTADEVIVESGAIIDTAYSRTCQKRIHPHAIRIGDRRRAATVASFYSSMMMALELSVEGCFLGYTMTVIDALKNVGYRVCEQQGSMCILQLDGIGHQVRYVDDPNHHQYQTFLSQALRAIMDGEHRVDAEDRIKGLSF